MRLLLSRGFAAFTLAGTCCLALAVSPGAVAPKADSELLTELAAFEQHLTSLSEKLLDATVGITIGANEGSGVIVTPDGYVLTVAHVFLRDSKRRYENVRIRMRDGSLVRGAKALGCSTTSDYGLVKLPERSEPYPYAELGSTKDLAVNDIVLGTGHTGGFDEDRNAVLRFGRLLSKRGAFIRSDCKINKGDSGGPLFDYDGRVIGIHSRIYPPLAANLHVPIDKCVENWERLVSGERWSERSRSRSGYRSRAILGVTVMDSPLVPGCLVQDVHTDMPAEGAGVESGDIIVGVDGREVTSHDDLTRILARRRPGQTVEVEIRRGDDVLEFKIELAEASW